MSTFSTGITAMFCYCLSTACVRCLRNSSCIFHSHRCRTVFCLSSLSVFVLTDRSIVQLSQSFQPYDQHIISQFLQLWTQIPFFVLSFGFCPCVDEKASQEGYANFVADWHEYHDDFPPTNLNNIAKNLRGFQLQYQLFDCATVLFKDIPCSRLRSDEGTSAIVKSFHKSAHFSIFTDIFEHYTTLINTRSGQNESFKRFEFRF